MALSSVSFCTRGRGRSSTNRRRLSKHRIICIIILCIRGTEEIREFGFLFRRRCKVPFLWLRGSHGLDMLEKRLEAVESVRVYGLQHIHYGSLRSRYLRKRASGFVNTRGLYIVYQSIVKIIL